MSKTWLFIMLAICVLALVYVVYNYISIKKLTVSARAMILFIPLLLFACSYRYVYEGANGKIPLIFAKV